MIELIGVEFCFVDMFIILDFYCKLSVINLLDVILYLYVVGFMFKDDMC